MSILEKFTQDVYQIKEGLARITPVKLTVNPIITTSGLTTSGTSGSYIVYNSPTIYSSLGTSTSTTTGTLVSNFFANNNAI